MAKVRVGVIGCGVMGSNHTRIASEHKDAKLIGIFDQNPERAKEIAEKYKVTAFDSPESLFAEVDAAIIATPTSTHLEVARLGLEKGKHLLVEKPLTLDSTSTELLATAATKANKVLVVGMIERFNPAFQKAKSIVKKDKILGIVIERFSPFPERISDASVVWDMMIHDIDLALSLNHSGVDSVKANGKKIKSDKIDEANCTIYFKDGTIAKIASSRAKIDKYRHIQISTDRAIYDIDLLARKLYQREYETLINKVEIEVNPGDQIELEQKDFYRAITEGREPKCPASQAIPVMKVAEEVEEKCLSR